MHEPGDGNHHGRYCRPRPDGRRVQRQCPPRGGHDESPYNRACGERIFGGGTGGTQTLAIDNTKVPLLAAPNIFNGNQTIIGNLAVNGVVTAPVVDISELTVGGQPFAYGTMALGNSFLGFAGNLTASNSNNTGVGHAALLNLTSGSGDTAVGESALNLVSGGSDNTAIGRSGLQFVTGDNNTGLGAQAGENITTGEYNTAVGNVSGPDITTPGVSNTTTLGAWATVFNNNATAIGYGAVANEDSSTAIGYQAQVDQPNTIVLGGINGVNGATADTSVGIGTTTPDAMLTVNGSADKPGGGSWGVYSDRRLKDLDGEFSAGLSQILKINPVKYRYKEENGMGIRDHNEHVGVVAQEIQKAIPEAVTENSKGYLLVNNDPVIWAMLNAIKEQQKEIAALRKRAAKLESTVAQLKHSRKEGIQLASEKPAP